MDVLLFTRHVWPFCKPRALTEKLQSLSAPLLTWLITSSHILTSVMTHEMKPKRKHHLLCSGNVFCICCDRRPKDSALPKCVSC